MNIDGAIFLCGTPRPRDWLANLAKNSQFEFRLKESVQQMLLASAEIVVDRDERMRIMTAPQTQWYRDQVDSVTQLVDGSPIVRVRFSDPYEALNPTS